MVEEFDLDIIVCGMLAIVHARNSSTSILRGFGQSEPANSLWDAKRCLWYSVAYTRRRGELGITLTARKDSSTGEVEYERWIPMESFHNAKLTLECER